jgi:hypothetical protein
MLNDIEPLTAEEQVFAILARTPVDAGIVATMVFGAVQRGQTIVSVIALLLV